MGLKCSLLGHAYEPADVERERKEEGSEVVTVTREIERCVRCETERVVSESTEVTAVVGEDEVDLAEGTTTAGEDHPAVDEAVETGGGDEFADRDPAEEDAEILTDEAPDREPGAWPKEPDETWDPEDGPESAPGATGEADESTDGATTDDAGTDAGPVRPDEETLSGITVPEGRIVCPECQFGVDAESAYREGDPCPDCGAWLTSERNR
jgi:hypothetical protein